MYMEINISMWFGKTVVRLHSIPIGLVMVGMRLYLELCEDYNVSIYMKFTLDLRTLNYIYVELILYT